MDEFENDGFDALPLLTPAADGNANARKRFEIARVVSRIYRAANGSLRADMLAHLLRPMGVLGLVSVASGAFARLVRRDGLIPDTISAEEMVRYSSEQIRDLTIFVHEVDPQALQPLIEQLAQNGMSIAALSTAALVMLLHSSRERSARTRRTVSGLDPTMDNRRSERS